MDVPEARANECRGEWPSGHTGGPASSSKWPESSMCFVPIGCGVHRRAAIPCGSCVDQRNRHRMRRSAVCTSEGTGIHGGRFGSRVGSRAGSRLPRSERVASAACQVEHVHRGWVGCQPTRPITYLVQRKRKHSRIGAYIRPAPLLSASCCAIADANEASRLSAPLGLLYLIEKPRAQITFRVSRVVTRSILVTTAHFGQLRWRKRFHIASRAGKYS